MKQRQQAPQISSVLNLLHFGNMLCRFLTLDEMPRVTHCAYKNRTPDSPEAVAGIFSKVQDQREASLAAAAALAEKKYGYVFYYVNAHGHTFGVAVHFPRFESEGIGFLNFHCFDYVTAIPADLQFKFSGCSDHERNKQNV